MASLEFDEVSKSYGTGVLAVRGLTLTVNDGEFVGSSRVDLQACKLEYSIVSPK